MFHLCGSSFEWDANLGETGIFSFLCLGNTNINKKVFLSVWSINKPFRYTLQSLNVILTSLKLDPIYNRKQIFSMLSTEMVDL